MHYLLGAFGILVAIFLAYFIAFAITDSIATICDWSLTTHKWEFKWQDMWIGAFPRTTWLANTESAKIQTLDVWLIIVPMVPLHLTYLRSVAKY